MEVRPNSLLVLDYAGSTSKINVWEETQGKRQLVCLPSRLLVVAESSG